MRVSLKRFDDLRFPVDLLCLPLFEDKPTADKQLKQLDKLLNGALRTIVKGEFFSGKASERFRLVPVRNQSFAQLLLVGLGKRDKCNADRLRKLAGVVGAAAVDSKVKRVGIILPAFKRSEIDWELVGRAATEGVQLGSYLFDYFKSATTKKEAPISLTFYLPAEADSRKAKVGAEYGLVVSELQNHCRDLVDYPSNVLTPTYLANDARKLGRKYGFKVQVFNKAQIEKMKMGAFLGVAKGSAEPPRFIKLDYRPKGRVRKHVVLVGKGITFDTGGISLKPGAKMDEMKGDMGGAATVLCTTAAIARLGMDIHVTTLIPACENMPGSKAYKPGDILTACNGKTIEIINTDAEGRLILADALAYGARMKPDYLIDCATLTGGTIVAFGYISAAMMGTADELFAQMTTASQSSGEKIWQLPLWDEYEASIKSQVADMKNSGGRPASTITAAKLLQHFTGDVPWLHVDIASVDREFTGYEYMPKGATGFGVRLLTEMLRNLR